MRRTFQFAIAAAVVAVLCAATVRAQQPPAGGSGQAPAAGAAPPAASTPAPAQGQASGSGYTYDPSGRRDPFVSLLGRGDPRAAANRPAGIAGLLINEINLKGIMRDRTGYVAMIQGPDHKTYMVKPGDKLMDGSVKSIDASAVVFSQDVNDPLSLIKQREIRKSLRSEESRG